MKSLINKNNLIYFLIGLFLFFADRILKFLSLNDFFNDKIIGINNFLYFDFYRNYKMALSIDIDNRFVIVVSIFIIFLITYLLIYNKIKKQKNTNNLEMNFGVISLVLFGGISNIFDRIYYGFVIDYINFININVFNIADVMIVSAAIIIFFKYITKKHDIKN